MRNNTSSEDNNPKRGDDNYKDQASSENSEVMSNSEPFDLANAYRLLIIAYMKSTDKLKYENTKSPIKQS